MTTNERTGADRVEVWDHVLFGLIAFTAGYGLTMVFAGAFVGEQLFDRLGFGPTNGGIPDGAPKDYAGFIFGVLGAVIIGWMTILGAVALGPFRRREQWAWTALVTSIGVWFVLDTGMSLMFGWTTHATFNVPFAAALLAPMVKLKPQFG